MGHGAAVLVNGLVNVGWLFVLFQQGQSCPWSGHNHWGMGPQCCCHMTVVSQAYAFLVAFNSNVFGFEEKVFRRESDLRNTSVVWPFFFLHLPPKWEWLVHCNRAFPWKRNPLYGPNIDIRVQGKSDPKKVLVTKNKQGQRPSSWIGVDIRVLRFKVTFVELSTIINANSGRISVQLQKSDIQLRT